MQSDRSLRIESNSFYPYLSIMHTLEEWRRFFSSRGVRQEEAEPLLSYIDKLNRNNLPIIFDFYHLALLLGVNVQYLASVVNSPEHHWRSFKLKKRSGGFRRIDVPYPTLLFIQRWIYGNILSKVPVSPYCHGFREGKSIVTNAQWHVGQHEMLKLDISDFFPSISINRVISIFRGFGYSDKVSFYLASLCCLNAKLPQGAPTSPYLSNLVARMMDSRIVRLSKKLGLHYTRYADDITLSGDSIHISLIGIISKIVEENGFRLNCDKTRLYKKGVQRIVTGIRVSDRLSLPRQYKRRIKQEMFYIRKYGLLDHLEKTKTKQRNYCASLLGKICFWLQVEPENGFALDSKRYMMMLMRKGFKDI